MQLSIYGGGGIGHAQSVKTGVNLVRIKRKIFRGHLNGKITHSLWSQEFDGPVLQSVGQVGFVVQKRITYADINLNFRTECTSGVSRCVTDQLMGFIPPGFIHRSECPLDMDHIRNDICGTSIAVDPPQSEYRGEGRITSTTD